MKKIYLLFLILFAFTTSVTVAQSSHDKISYQSVVRDGSNHLLYDTQVTVAVSIKNSGDPAVKYSETHTVTSNANGLISFLIGAGNNQNGNWNAVQWNHADITLVTSVNGNVLSTHTYPLSAVPYALYAKNADTAIYADSVNLTVVQNFIQSSGYLTDELQVLSISNDTIYLSKGGWVKLPAGFSGDYNDLTNKPDLKPVATSGDYNDLVNKPMKTDLCDSVKDCVKGWISDSTQMVFDTLHTYYATRNALSDTAAAIRGALVDTASNIRGALVDTTEAIRNSLKDTVNHYIGTKTLTIKQGTNTLGTFNANQSDNDVEVNISVPDAQVQTDWNATSGMAELLNKPNIRDSVNKVVKDSLKIGTSAINKAVDTIAANIAGNAIHDSLSNYKIKNCSDVDACVATAIGNNNSAINQAIDTIARNNIHDTAVAIRTHIRDSVNVVMLDSLEAANSAINQAIDTIAGNAIHDSLSNYKIENCSDVDACVATAIGDNNSAINQAIDTIARNNIHDTAVAIRTHIRDSVNVVMLDSLAAANSAINHAIDTIAGSAIHDSLSDYKIKNCTDVEKCMETTLGNYVLKTAVRDSVNNAVTDALKDPTSVINYAVDTIARHNIHDTAVAIRMHIRDSVNVVMLDSLAAANSAINHAIDTIAGNAIHDSLSDYKIKNCTDVEKCMETTLGNYVLKTAVRDSVNNAVTDALKDPTSVINYAVDTIARNNIHDTAMAIRLHIRDSVNVVMLDSLAAANSAINQAIDTIARNNIHDTAVAIRTHIRDSVNVVMLDSLEAASSAINQAIDTIAGNAIHDSLSNYKIKNCNDVNACVATAIGDNNSAVNQAIDTIARNNIHDTAVAIRLHIRDSVNVVMLDSLAAANSAINKAIDTIARHNIHDTAVAIRTHIRDSVNVVMLDSLAAANSAINQAIDTIARHNIHDTAVAIRTHIRDSVNVVMLDSLAAANSAINHAIDTIAGNAIHDSLSDYKIKNCTDVEKCMETTLGNYVLKTAVRDSITNNVNLTVKNDSLFLTHGNDIDTVPAGKMIHDSLSHYDIKDCADVITCVDNALANPNSTTNHAIDSIALNSVKDTLGKYTTTDKLDTVIRKYDYATNTRLTNDSTWLQANIDTVSSHIRAIIPAAPGRLNTDHADAQTVNNSESLSGNVDLHKVSKTGSYNDLNDKPTPPNDNLITIQMNGQKVDDFTLNQSTDKTINLQNVAIDTAANTFSGKNTFTDTNYVLENGFSFEDPNKTTTSNCQVMVNACDLLALFDSLSSRIDKLTERVNQLEAANCPTLGAVTVSDTTFGSATLTATIGNYDPLTVKEFGFLISTSEINGYDAAIKYPVVDKTAAGVFTMNATGLQPDTKYYVKAYALNDSMRCTDSTMVGAQSDWKTKQFAVTSSASSVCAGKPVTLTATTTDISNIGTVTYTWSTNASSSYIIATPDKVGDTTFMVSATYGGYTVTASATVTVKRLPDATITSDQDPDPVYSPAVLTVAEEDPNATFAWDTLSMNEWLINMDDDKLRSISVNPAGRTFYTVKVTLDGCEARDTIEVLNHQCPTLEDVVVSENSTTAMTTFSSSISGFNAQNVQMVGFLLTLDETWSVDVDTLRSTPPDNDYDGTNYLFSKDTMLVAGIRYYVRAFVKVDPTVCAGDGTGTVQGNPTEHLATASLIESNNNNICNGGSVTLTAPSGDGYHYRWAPGEEETQSITVQPSSNQTTTYRVTVTNGTEQNVYSRAVSVLQPVTLYGDQGSNSDELVFFVLRSNSPISDPDVHYEWKPVENSEDNDTIAIPIGTSAEKCYVTVTLGNCSVSDSTKIERVKKAIQLCDVATVTDHEGNIYNVVAFENTYNFTTPEHNNDLTQCWTKENMRAVTSPSTGTYLIKNVYRDNFSYAGKIACWPGNDSSRRAPLNFGVLYNWQAAFDMYIRPGDEDAVSTSIRYFYFFNDYPRGICPVGWHISRSSEWDAIEVPLAETDFNDLQPINGGPRGNEYNTYGSKMVSGVWDYSGSGCRVGDNNCPLRNSSDLSVLPAASNSDVYIDKRSYFWTSEFPFWKQGTNYYFDHASYIGFFANSFGPTHGYQQKGVDMSVRCVKDYDTKYTNPVRLYYYYRKNSQTYVFGCETNPNPTKSVRIRGMIYSTNTSVTLEITNPSAAANDLVASGGASVLLDNEYQNANPNDDKIFEVNINFVGGTMRPFIIYDDNSIDYGQIE